MSKIQRLTVSQLGTLFQNHKGCCWILCQIMDNERKDQEPEIECLSDWICAIRLFVRNLIDNLQKSVYKDPNPYSTIVRYLHDFPHYMRLYFIVFADKASNRRITSNALIMYWTLIVTSKVIPHTNVLVLTKMKF